MKRQFACRLEQLGNALGHVSVAIIALLAFPVLYDVVARAAGHPTIWAFETTLYALIAGGFLANAYALKSGNHFRVKILLTLFPRYRTFFNRLSLIITFLFSVIIVVAGGMLAHYSFVNDIRSPTLLNTPQYLPELVIPLGGLALAVQSLSLLLSGRDADGEIHDI